MNRDLWELDDEFWDLRCFLIPRIVKLNILFALYRKGFLFILTIHYIVGPIVGQALYQKV